MIEIRHLEKSYDDFIPLKDVNAVINEGDVIAVIGPSGTGKSTLLRCLNLLDPPTGGQIIFEGEDITEPGYDATKVRQKMGMVFQSFNLFSNMTVIENVMFAPVQLLGMKRQEACDRAMSLLREVGLGEKYLNYPDELSGGQKQRVAIARTLAMDPQVILFDEPTSALDPTMVGEVETVIEDLARQGKTMMIVTHDMQFTKKVSNRVFYMDQGMLYEDGTPEQIFEHPGKELTRRFVKHLKVLELDVESHDFDFVGAIAAIDRYCYKNKIDPKLTTRIQSVVEEMIMQILLPVMEKPDIHVTIEYSEKDEEAEIMMRYTGTFDPAQTDNDIAYMLLRARASSITHEVTDDGLGSVLRIHMK